MEKGNQSEKELKQLEDALKKEDDLNKREIEVKNAEQARDAGYQDERVALNTELHQQRIKIEAEIADIRKTKLSELEKEITEFLNSSLEGILSHEQNERNRIHLEIKKQREDALQSFTAKSNRLAELKTQLFNKNQTIENKIAELIKREQTIISAEQARDAGFNDERDKLNKELRNKRDNVEKEITENREKQLSHLETEIAALKNKRLEDCAKAENIERERIRKEISHEREVWEKQQADTRKQLEAERTELEKQKGALSALQSENEGRRTELEANERTLERKAQRLEQQWQKRNDQLNDEMDSLLKEERKSMESQKQSTVDENNRLRNALKIQTDLLAGFEQIKHQLGDKDPAEVIRDLNSQSAELSRLREELATRPTEEMRERYKSLEQEAKTQQARAEQLQRQVDNNVADVLEVATLRREKSELDATNKSLIQKASIFESAANEAQAELNRLRAAYERPVEIAARYKEIEIPRLEATTIIRPPIEAEIDEITWLAGVGNACDNYGLHFNPRILKAFHTALKTAEMSPLTILAGVSGTGKSELPRLYSHFGGIFFEPISVQPNWDSQESMLGFFNSIDNKFDAQPLLRFLAQSQKPWQENTNGNDGYPGLSDAVCLVLLDEMNLAHPELYFAEFLSKLELRRGKKAKDVPSLPIKIGAGMKPYDLKLGRNMLWVGTMNQDETTKSLSDKVIDRSIIINFPRPTELKRRGKLTPLDENNRSPALHKKSWNNWVETGKIPFNADDIKEFKTFIESMNTALGISGRAIGHRVWQSIEYYMMNYPDVRTAQKLQDKDALAKAMHVAFEDQLVQKVMPKLRGIDTRGKSKTECLDKIRGQILAGVAGNPFNLAEDFDLACELGYGQFIWQSANYLKEE